MNIFVLDTDPKKCAEYHNDKHVVKMILEQSQILCSVHWVLGNEAPYKLTHKNHPCSIWARECIENYIWLCEMTLELCKEYTYRYGKVHKCEQTGLVKSLFFTPKNIPNQPFTEPTPAMPDDVKVAGNSIASYRNYYINNKTHLAKWSGKINSRNVPEWFNANI